MRNPFVRATLLAATASLTTLACGTVRVSVPVMRPAEVNMSAYRSIAVGGLTGNANHLFASALEESLVKSERFLVVDRSHMDKVMRELQLSSSDLADPDKAAKLGKQVTANALIFGNVEEHYKEERKDEPFTDKKGVRHILHRLTGVVRVTAEFKITDVSTGALVVAKSLEEKREDDSTGYDEAPKAIDREGLSKAARKAVLSHFVHAIVPHKEYLDATFFTEGDLPQLETGIGYARRGDWKKAQDTFNEAIGAAERNPKINSKVLGKAYWNLGLAYEYNGEYDKAGKMIDKAFQLTQDADMLAEQDNIKRLEGEAKKLAEQGSAKPAEAVNEKQ